MTNTTTPELAVYVSLEVSEPKLSESGKTKLRSITFFTSKHGRMGSSVPVGMEKALADALYRAIGETPPAAGAAPRQTAAGSTLGAARK